MLNTVKDLVSVGYCTILDGFNIRYRNGLSQTWIPYWTGSVLDTGLDWFSARDSNGLGRLQIPYWAVNVRLGLGWFNFIYRTGSVLDTILDRFNIRDRTLLGQCR
jgi:hypothetical protein